MLPLTLQKGYREQENFNLKSKPIFHSLPVVDPEALQISMMELFMTTVNNFQLLNIRVKISEPAYDNER